MNAFLATIGIAFAQDYTDGTIPPLDAQTFRPSIDAVSMVWVDDAAVRNRTFTGRGVLHYALDPLVYYSATGERTPLVHDVLQLDLTGGYGLGPVRAGMHLPLYLLSTGAAGGQTGLGDVAFDLKGRVLDPAKAPLGVALSMRVTVPTNTTSTALGYEGIGWELSGIVDRSFGPVQLAANLGFQGFPPSELENIAWRDQLTARLGGAWTIRPQTGVSVEATGDFTLGAFSNPSGRPIEGIATAWFRPAAHGLVFRGGMGTGLTEGIGAPRMRALATVAWEPVPAKDTDGDGLVDAMGADVAGALASVDGTRLQDSVEVPGGSHLIAASATSAPIAPPPPPPFELHATVYFDLDQATIRPVSFAELNDVAAKMIAHPEIKHVRVEGHTDSRATVQHNLDLSQRRAESVRQYLINRGVEASRIEAEGFGESRPRAQGEDEEAWQQNRRVDFVIVP